MGIGTMPLDMWIVVEPLTRDQLKPVSTYTTQRGRGGTGSAQRSARETAYSACTNGTNSSLRRFGDREWLVSAGLP